MKRFFNLLLNVIMIASMATTAFAADLNNIVETDDAVITANVPSSHEIKIETDGNGKVYLDGITVNRIIADRLSSPIILICPKSGYAVDKIMLGDEDITRKVSGGYYTFDAVYKDNILKATFKKAENGSFKYSVVGSITKNNKPAENILLELRSILKTYTMGKDGKFGFRDIQEGHHTLNAVENGKVVGYVEFYLTPSNSSKNLDIDKNIDGSYNIQANKKFSIIELDFNLAENGKLEITKSNATNKPEDVKDYPNAPKTVDNSNVMLYFIMSLLSLGVIVIPIINSKRRKQINE